MIDADIYRNACKLNEAQNFAISMKNWEYQTAKTARLEADQKHIILDKYHDFLHVFSKKNSNTLSLY